MKIIKATTSLSLLLVPNGRNFVAAAADRSGIPPLEGAEPAAKSDIYDELKGYQNVDNGALVAIANAGYTYYLRINATLPLKLSGNGELEVDRCVEWMSDANDSNFTWYGLQVQLPDDASTTSGRYYPDVTRATKELGYVQQYNTTPPVSILGYNFTTKESQPTIRINFNDEPFWDTYTFNFVDQGSVVAGDANYQEFKKTMNGAVSCYATPASESWRTVLAPVIPTLTITLQRFGGGDDTPPSPAPASAAYSPHSGKVFGLSLATFAAVWTSFFI